MRDTLRRPFVNRKALVRALDTDALRTVIDALGLDADTSERSMRAALSGSRAATTRRILSVLDDETLALIVDRIGFERPSERSVTQPENERKAPEQSRFVAIDFETADSGADSACAVALVRVHGREIVQRAYRLIRPPRQNIPLSWVHGLTWADVGTAPPFAKVWPELTPLLEGAHFLVAHNAGFDRAVMRACCAKAGLAMPRLRFKCTVKWSRRTFDLPRANLPTVCEHLGIELDHHQALSDAEACAKIMIEVQERWRRRSSA